MQPRLCFMIRLLTGRSGCQLPVALPPISALFSIKSNIILTHLFRYLSTTFAFMNNRNDNDHKVNSCWDIQWFDRYHSNLSYPIILIDTYRVVSHWALAIFFRYPKRQRKGMSFDIRLLCRDKCWLELFRVPKSTDLKLWLEADGIVRNYYWVWDLDLPICKPICQWYVLPFDFLYSPSLAPPDTVRLHHRMGDTKMHLL